MSRSVRRRERERDERKNENEKNRERARDHLTMKKITAQEM